MKVRNKFAVWGALAMTALATTASMAWACTPSPVMTINPGTGPAGTDIIVASANFEPGPVEIRWNSFSGPVAGSAASGSATVQAPADFAPGAYYLIALQRNAAGEVVAKAATTYQVTNGSAASLGADSASQTLWSGFDSGGSNALDQQLAPQLSGNGLGLKVGLPMAALGLAGLAAAGIAATARRRSRATNR